MSSWIVCHSSPPRFNDRCTDSAPSVHWLGFTEFLVTCWRVVNYFKPFEQEEKDVIMERFFCLVVCSMLCTSCWPNSVVLFFHRHAWFVVFFISVRYRGQQNRFKPFNISPQNARKLVDWTELELGGNGSFHRVNKLFSGLGTKWCGAGDIAQSYDDLGSLTELDKCCRAHDHCPIKVNGMASAHGLINLSLYTKYVSIEFSNSKLDSYLFSDCRSHCACDDEFYTCLKVLDSHVARMIGNLYFNVIQVPCVDQDISISSGGQSAKLQYLSPELCTARNARSCTQPIPQHTYKFVQVNREF